MKISRNSGQDGNKGFVPAPYMYNGKPYNTVDELEAAVVANPPSPIPGISDNYKGLIRNILLIDSDIGSGVPNFLIRRISSKLPKKGSKDSLLKGDNVVFQINGKFFDLGFDLNEMRELFKLLISNNYYELNPKQEITLKDINDELNRLSPGIVDERDKYDNKYIRLEKLIFDYEADFSKAIASQNYLEALNICAQAIRKTGKHKDLILLERWTNRQEEIIELAAKEVFEKLVLTGRYDETLKLCQNMFGYTFKRDQYKKLGDNYMKLFNVKKNVWEQRLDDLIYEIAEKLYDNFLVIKDYKKIQELCLFMMKSEEQIEDRNFTRNRTNIIKIKNSNSIWENRYFDACLNPYFKTDSK